MLYWMSPRLGKTHASVYKHGHVASTTGKRVSRGRVFAIELASGQANPEEKSAYSSQTRRPSLSSPANTGYRNTTTAAT